MSLINLALVAGLAVAAPLITSSVPRAAAVPVLVVEILSGVLAGPHALGWLQVDAALDILALLGVTFLFFLAGLEVDLARIRGQLLARSVAAYVLGLCLALTATLLLHHAGLLTSPGLVAVALSATGLGLVVPILRDSHALHTPTGGVIVAFASVAEFSAVLVLALAFSSGGTPLWDLALLVVLVVTAVTVTVAGEHLRSRSAVGALLDRLSGGTTLVRVRLSVALVIGFAALAEAGGLEVVLGAFFAGGVLNVLDQGMSESAFRRRLDGIGYGFLIPVFFVVSGARLDFSTLSWWPDALGLLPLLLVSLLLARAVPSILFAPGPIDHHALGVGLLCSTSLPFLVTAAQVGVSSGRIDESTAAAMTTAGLLGVCLFPAVAAALLAGGSTPRTDPHGDAQSTVGTSVR